MKNLLFLLLVPFISFSQIQIGDDIDGESMNDYSGCSVSLSSDGSVVAIGAYLNAGKAIGAGHVRVFKNINNVWTQLGGDIDGEKKTDFSGWSLSLSSDGNVVAISSITNDGANGEDSGQVRVFKNINNIWTQIGGGIDGENEDDQFGYSISISSDGSIVAIGTPYNDDNGGTSGHVRVFKNIDNVWTQIGSDIDGEAEADYSGSSISLSSDGDVLAIGAHRNDGNGRSSGHVRVFRNIDNVWTQIGSDINGEEHGDTFGFSVSLSSDGSIIAVGAPTNDGTAEKAGHVRVFRNINNVWTQIGNDIDGESMNDESGSKVSISADGSIVAIAAPNNHNDSGLYAGHVRIFKNENDVWTQIGENIDGEFQQDYSGYSLSISSDASVVAIGAVSNDIAGHVRLYDLSAVLSTQSFEKDYFSYYPNPVKDILNIQLNKGLELKQVNIYNLQSQYLYSVKTSKIDVSKLASGLYFIEVETNQGKSAKKIIIN
ncbi:T9SS type A sorting domain-containing protein [Hyunsoonleella sp. SJ7]|uniref:T9SS type A sorting domain-containing protein n=1 Tax=Hyunsoonleella aquatilis TaxID=2762758 RepID=A0A923HIH2_9FLAO|nr:T9SS type A sorting domain-containing protein [Hyunsoonleella aquatilis]MBC3759915.1 T9SS type A sorting domain-containing protein [Hyunsoonleella aquatilis]